MSAQGVFNTNDTDLEPGSTTTLALMAATESRYSVQTYAPWACSGAQSAMGAQSEPRIRAALGTNETLTRGSGR